MSAILLSSAVHGFGSMPEPPDPEPGPVPWSLSDWPDLMTYPKPTPYPYETMGPLWDGTPGYALKTFAGESAFAVKQYFTEDMITDLFDEGSAVKAAVWNDEKRFYWCGSAADPLALDVKTHARESGTALVPYACSARVPEANELFQNALTLRYAFQDNEAACTFRKAVDVDKDCALAHLGFTLAVGPNVNYANLANADVYTEIMDHLVDAAAITDKGVLEGMEATVSAGLLDALKIRYLPFSCQYDTGECLSADETEQISLEVAAANPAKAYEAYEANAAAHSALYSEKMKTLVDALPDDTMVALVTVGSLMQNPAWKWWAAGSDGYNGSWAHPMITQVSAKIEANNAKANELIFAVIRQEGMNTGANHYMIHNMESGPFPGWASAAANLLQSLGTTGHVQHMSAHTFARTGYHMNSIEWNKRANYADFAWAIGRAGGYVLSPIYRYEAHDTQFQSEAGMNLYNWRELVASLALLHHMIGYATYAEWGIKLKADLGLLEVKSTAYGNRVFGQYLYPLRFGLYTEILASIDASPVGKDGRFKVADCPTCYIETPTVLQARMFSESVAASRSGDAARGKAALSDLLEYDFEGYPPGEVDGEVYSFCTDASAECVSQACEYYLTKWETEKMQTLDRSSADAVGTTTINNGDALRCMNLLVPWAEIEVAEGEIEAAIETLVEAAETQEKLQYDEPSPFFYPVKATLGKLYIKQAQFQEAAQTFREALFTHPRSFQLVMGLNHALAALGGGRELAVKYLVDEVLQFNDTAFNVEYL